MQQHYIIDVMELKDIALLTFGCVGTFGVLLAVLKVVCERNIIYAANSALAEERMELMECLVDCIIRMERADVNETAALHLRLARFRDSSNDLFHSCKRNLKIELLNAKLVSQIGELQRAPTAIDLNYGGIQVEEELGVSVVTAGQSL